MKTSIEIKIEQAEHEVSKLKEEAREIEKAKTDSSRWSKKLDAVDLCENSKYEKGFALSNSPNMAHLWQVSLQVERASSGAGTKTTQQIHYVIAETAKDAISQASCSLESWDLQRSAEVVSTAHRLPLMVRGWGHSSF
jgi:hypothetical protein